MTDIKFFEIQHEKPVTQNNISGIINYVYQTID